MVPTAFVMIELDEGNELFLKKKFQESIEKYEIVLEQEPNNFVALNNKGYSLSKLKKYSEALSCYDKFLQNSSNDKTVLINKISIFRKTKEFDKAIVICDYLLEKNPDPNEEQVRYWLAGNLCRCTGYDKIVRAVQQAAEGETN